jgi:ribonuclease D
VAQANPASRTALGALSAMPANFNDAFAASLLKTLHETPQHPVDDAPTQDARPTPEQKALIERLAKIVDARAAELEVSAELLAPRGELKALALGKRDTHALSGWRRREIGDRLLEKL